ncbi:unnamed protein product [Prorocentrum cordatum]|uniref:Uncharacterized protein n=1 Tax=Prorocentrum cordatum TaxID=2364126 RepID=A0ABN9Y7Q0_9DINO|nr:unnamed protein product [Polarella glacialis]
MFAHPEVDAVDAAPAAEAAEPEVSATAAAAVPAAGGIAECCDGNEAVAKRRRLALKRTLTEAEKQTDGTVGRAKAKAKGKAVGKAKVKAEGRYKGQ